MQDVNKEEIEYDLGDFRNDTVWAFSSWPTSVYAPPKQVIPLTNEQLLTGSTRGGSILRTCPIMNSKNSGCR